MVNELKYFIREIISIHCDLPGKSPATEILMGTRDEIQDIFNISRTGWKSG